jgi:hypothetical protein
MTSPSEPKRMLEGDHQRALLARVAKEFRDVRFFRRNTGLIKLDDRVFRAGLPGQCDLYVLGRGGWHGEVEVKRFGKLTEEQEHWRDWCSEWRVSWLLLEAYKSELPAATVDRWVNELRVWLP